MARCETLMVFQPGRDPLELDSPLLNLVGMMLCVFLLRWIESSHRWIEVQLLHPETLLCILLLLAVALLFAPWMASEERL